MNLFGFELNLFTILVIVGIAIMIFTGTIDIIFNLVKVFFDVLVGLGDLAPQ